MVVCLEQDADLHMAQLMPLLLIGFTYLVPAHPGSPGKRAVKRVCVCVLAEKRSHSLYLNFLTIQCRIGRRKSLCQKKTS